MISIVPALSDAESTVPGNGKANAGMTGARILVVDDEKPTADMLATYLEAVGYNTSAVYTAKEGLSSLKKEHYDLIVTDLMLSDMRGIQLLEAIRKQGKKVSVVVMTGYATIESGIEAIQKGAIDFIAKPFSCKDLETVIERGSQEGRRVSKGTL